MFNGVLFLGLPTMVVHRVDYNSPLAPPRMEGDESSEYPSPEAVRAHLRSRSYLEVLVLLSGTEDATASSIEARHSYTLDDILWDRAFCSCVSIDSAGKHCVDFANIHSTHPMTDALCTASPRSSPEYKHGELPLATHNTRCLPAMYEVGESSDESQENRRIC